LLISLSFLASDNPSYKTPAFLSTEKRAILQIIFTGFVFCVFGAPHSTTLKAQSLYLSAGQHARYLHCMDKPTLAQSQFQSGTAATD
jgi:hypothetical protein